MGVSASRLSTRFAAPFARVRRGPVGFAPLVDERSLLPHGSGDFPSRCWRVVVRSISLSKSASEGRRSSKCSQNAAEVGTESDESGERFLREAGLALKPDHPFAAHISGSGKEEDNVLWLALTFVSRLR